VVALQFAYLARPRNLDQTQVRLVCESGVVLLALSLTVTRDCQGEAAKDQKDLDAMNHFFNAKAQGRKEELLLVKVAWRWELHAAPAALLYGLERVAVSAFRRLKRDRASYLLLHLLPVALDAVARARLFLLSPAVN